MSLHILRRCRVQYARRRVLELRLVEYPAHRGSQRVMLFVHKLAVTREGRLDGSRSRAVALPLGPIAPHLPELVAFLAEALVASGQGTDLSTLCPPVPPGAVSPSPLPLSGDEIS